jgi:hypothetical protein
LSFLSSTYPQGCCLHCHCVLRAVCCVLCAVCCVLCAVCCVLCAVCCVLCAVCCVRHMQALPLAVCRLSSLEVLTVDTCMHITQLPDCLTQMSSLRELSLHNGEVSWQVTGALMCS